MTNKISKQKVISMTKFQLVTAKRESRLLPVVLIGNLILSIIIVTLQGVEYTTVGSVDLVTLSMAFFVAPAAFLYSFRMGLMNGVSRKTIMVSTAITLIIIALFFTTITTVFMLLSDLLANTFDLSTILFDRNPIVLFPWLFTVFLFLSVLPTFLSMFVTQTSKKVKLITMGVLFIIPTFITLINILFDNVIGNVFASFFRLLIGNTGSGHNNPFLSSLVFLGLSIIIGVGIYLFGRRYSINKK